MKLFKRVFLLLSLLFCLVALTGCFRATALRDPYAQIVEVFSGAGYAATLEDAREDVPVGIYNASVWKALRLGDETVMVYFDESNRAEYLANLIDESPFDVVTSYGQRYVLTYSGSDEALISFLEEL